MYYVEGGCVVFFLVVFKKRFITRTYSPTQLKKLVYFKSVQTICFCWLLQRKFNLCQPRDLKRKDRGGANGLAKRSRTPPLSPLLKRLHPLHLQSSKSV